MINISLGLALAIAHADSTACVPRVDTLRDTVFAVLAPARATSAVPPNSLVPALRLLLARARPGGLGLISVGTGPRGPIIDTRSSSDAARQPLPAMFAAVPGEYALTLHRDGSITGARIVTSARGDDIDGAFTHAFASTDPPPLGVPGPIYPSDITSDSLPLHLKFRLGADGSAASVPFAMRSLLVTRIDRQARPLADNPRPAYPAVSYRVTDTVLVQFAIDSAGRVDPATFYPLRARAQPFVDAVTAVVAGLRFEPALAGGCPTRTVLSQSFVIRPPAR